MQNLQKEITDQKRFFLTGKTVELQFRKKALLSLKNTVLKHESALVQALKTDLGKCAFESYASEIGIVLGEIRHALKHLKAMAAPKKTKTPLFLFPAKSQILPQPLGVCLIISPWNYPVQLSLAPIVAAITAGNCVVLKPSTRATATAVVIHQIIQESFVPEHVMSVQLTRDQSSALLEQPFDKFFFTGSQAVGRIIAKAAARLMVPVTLELGGKNPCIVDETADLQVTAKRITWGKFFNGGQTCVAPDYLVAHDTIKDTLIDEICKCIEAFYSKRPQESEYLGRMIDKHHLQTLLPLMKDGTVVVGGEFDEEDRYVAPTVIDDISWQDQIMKDEIFGPILPVIGYSDLNSALEKIRQIPKPLALYLFSTDKKTVQQVTHSVPFGGGCVNDTLIHFGSPYLPIGGVGESGMGRYHGDAGFAAFSHHKSIVTTPIKPSVNLRFPPYLKRNFSILKKLMK